MFWHWYKPEKCPRVETAAGKCQVMLPSLPFAGQKYVVLYLSIREFKHRRQVRLQALDLEESSKEHAQRLKSRMADSENDEFEVKSRSGKTSWTSAREGKKG